MNSELFEIKNLLLNLLQILQQETHIFNYCGLYTQKDLLNLLQISPNTLKSWEEKGLKRLEPPIEGTRTVYYKLENVLQFLEK
ncbi:MULTISPECIES: MerR family transcriptional regulator [Streptococcus]|jgi:hypothetical protein|uniref:MerR family transcriptional regulator n=4 Tax=Streptococcus TaxID=1301 RepID=A0A081Q6Y3_STRMT|nr:MULTISPECIES: MerR family transcriptional regulator [Streptococcus]RKW07114.1 MAG: MerR family transcriptional regulator [Streptococcus sp.]KEQ38706.1 phage protein [Streptococcus mitis]KXA58448.1 transcriptional regulator, MerR family [Streptococcus mitis]MDI2139276.1 MerR family transcriptional regulator [Streptococcus sp. IMAU 99199]MDK7308394.1 MerR family transcriptional regulator [Streptococcus oralis]